MTLRFLSFLATILILLSCGQKKEIQETVEAPSPEPRWLQDRPIQSGYYIGIGSSNKNSNPLDFAQVAKENALVDLASEIRITVSGESFLSTLEVNDYFQEEFISKVTSSTKEHLEGYEIIDTWEDDQQYWTYYRLAASEYKRIRAERKSNALSRSGEHFKRAKNLETQGDIKGAIGNYLDGMVGIHEYWTETNEFNLDGKTIYLDHELHNGFQDLLRDLRFELNPKEVVLDENNLFKASVSALVHIRGNPVQDFPLRYRITHDGAYVSFRSAMTNASGLLMIPVEDVSLDGGNTLRLELESGMDKLDFSGTEMQIRKPLMDEIEFDAKEIPIRLILPAMSIASDEQNFGEVLSNKMLASALQSELGSLGVKFASEDASYQINIRSNTRESGTSQGFHVAHLDLTVEVIHKPSGHLIYTWQESNVKGLQLNFEAAGKEAYKKAVKKLESSVGEEIIQAIL